MLSLPLFSCFLALHPYIFLNFLEFFLFSCFCSFYTFVTISIKLIVNNCYYIREYNIKYGITYYEILHKIIQIIYMSITLNDDSKYEYMYVYFNNNDYA